MKNFWKKNYSYIIFIISLALIVGSWLLVPNSLVNFLTMLLIGGIGWALAKYLESKFAEGEPASPSKR